MQETLDNETLENESMKKKNTISVCILAYNEQKHIAHTIQSIIENNKTIDFDVIVYANGCTDNTVEIVSDLQATYKNLYVRDIKQAGKSNAWNIAFDENKDKEILVFTDADIESEQGSIQALYEQFSTTSTTLACCQSRPLQEGLPFEQRFTAFLKTPIVQNYLSGCFYAINRKQIEEIFKKQNLSGIPEGVVGEDLFIELLVPKEQTVIVNKKCFYVPPFIQDYLKFLARMKWQRKQMDLFFKDSFDDTEALEKKSAISSLTKKWNDATDKPAFIKGLFVAVVRHLFILFSKKDINKYYESLGPIVEKGRNILVDTRATEAK